MFVWGWNQHGQTSGGAASAHTSGVLQISPIPNFVATDVALGFSHTLAIEKSTGRLWGMGNNQQRQVFRPGTAQQKLSLSSLHDIPFLEGYRIVKVGAGVMHSAVVTDDGSVIVFGGSRTTVYRWKPVDDDAIITHVVCGSRDLTVTLDSKGRIWTSGQDNKYGQLGRCCSSRKAGEKASNDSWLEFGMVGGLAEMRCQVIQCGWSHVLVIATPRTNETSTSLYGWGRNDRGQLGSATPTCHWLPTLLAPSEPKTMGCGSESSIILSVTNDLYSCGWNEHGNLGVVDCAGAEYVRSWKKQSNLDALLLRNPEMSADSCYVGIAANTCISASTCASACTCVGTCASACVSASTCTCVTTCASTCNRAPTSTRGSPYRRRELLFHDNL